MKRLALTLLAAIGICAGASAANPEIQIGYGGYTQMDATGMHDGVGKVKNAWGVLNAGVNLQVAPKLWIGPSYSFSSTKTKEGDINVYYHLIMLNARYEYWRNSMITLYAHAGLGADITHIGYSGSPKNKGYVAYQLSPIGVQTGIGSGVSLFGEFGFGAQGLLNVGVRIGL